MPKTNKKDPVFYYSESKDKHIDIDTMSDVHIKRAFKKIVKGSDEYDKKVINIAPKADHDSVYVFYNNLFDFNMFINARGADDAMQKFDQCGFAHRGQWKIMMELSQQPSEGPNGS